MSEERSADDILSVEERAAWKAGYLIFDGTADSIDHRAREVWLTRERWVRFSKALLAAAERKP